MTETEIIRYVSDLPGVVSLTASEEGGAPAAAWGDTFFFYDPDNNLPENQRLPFATIVIHDYAGWDTESNLDRDGIFRVNIAMVEVASSGCWATRPRPRQLIIVTSTMRRPTCSFRIRSTPLKAGCPFLIRVITPAASCGICLTRRTAWRQADTPGASSPDQGGDSFLRTKPHKRAFSPRSGFTCDRVRRNAPSSR